MGNLETAVRLTRRYASYFSFPLTAETLFHFLISGQTYSRSSLKSFFSVLQPKEKKLLTTRYQISQAKLQRAHSLLSLFSVLPTVSLVAVTGSLAVNNAHADDDIDLMVIVSPDTLWLTRPLIVVLLKLLRLRRPGSTSQHHSPAVTNKICDNLWLDETALALPENKRNLYTAHEVLQALPIFDRGGVYQRFIQANSWTKKYLANAYAIALKEIRGSGARAAQRNKKAVQGCPKTARKDAPVLSERSEHGFDIPNRITRVFNTLAFKLQYLYMKKKITNETVSLHAAYFHPRNLASELAKHLRAKK